MNNTNSPGNFSERLENFVDHLQSVRNDEFAKNFEHCAPPRVMTSEGRRYVKIYAQDREFVRDAAGDKTSEMRDCGQRSVICFVDKVNGDILKAATWKAPVTKSARGSIFASVLPGSAFGGFYVDSPNVEVRARVEDEPRAAVALEPATVLKAGAVDVAALDAIFA